METKNDNTIPFLDTLVKKDPWSIPVLWLKPPSTSWMQCCQVLIRLIKKYHHQLGDDIFPLIIELSTISEQIDTPIIQESAGI